MVVVIVAIMIGGMLLPLSVQDDLRRTRESEKRLQEVEEALLGFAIANERLPCPATKTSSGQESFATGGSATDGACSNFFDGFLPAAALGLGPVDGNGLLLDGWNRPIRYAVTDKTINSIDHAFTKFRGIKDAKMENIAGATLLSVYTCATGPSGCSAATKLTDKAPALVYSSGKPDDGEASGADAKANRDGNAVFVSHVPSPPDAASGEFDDLVVWLSPNILFNRMIAAGRLP